MCLSNAQSYQNSLYITGFYSTFDINTNATLFRDKIAQYDKCHLCDQKQTMNHLFVSCPDVQIFWQSFSRWWNVQNDDFIVLNDETIIYGFTNDFSQQLGLNKW